MLRLDGSCFFSVPWRTACGGLSQARKGLGCKMLVDQSRGKDFKNRQPGALIKHCKVTHVTCDMPKLRVVIWKYKSGVS